ncbi:ABC transporter ATP-binding protein [Paenibacillus gansuensis]|uniref:ABC transporter ATP-binding protein n=1 Tax=Paenibacillus gansuensis TaxID=306542 RepID=A0ABW5PA33_9BACL
MDRKEAYIRLDNISHQFHIGKKGSERIIPVLHEINLHIRKGDIVSIIGRSGSGKSTLLNLISGYIRPSEGQIIINGRDVSRLSEGDWAHFRLEHFGFIFQSFQLIPSMTAYANIELPLILKGMDETARRVQTMEMLRKVNLEEYAEHYPSELSGGQQQRVSIARALVVNPPIILADEPTGSLDSENEDSLLSFIRKLNEEEGITFLMITHDDKVASIADHIITLKDGRIA